MNCFRQDRRKIAETALIVANGGEIVEPLLGAFDLARSRIVDVLRIGFVDRVLAQPDQLTAQIKIVDRASVIARIDDGDGAGGETVQIGVPSQLGKGLVMLEIEPQRMRVGFLSALQLFADGLVNTAMGRLGEMLDPEKIGNLLVGAIIHQQGTQQRLFRLDICGRHAPAGNSILIAAVIAMKLGNNTRLRTCFHLSPPRTVHLYLFGTSKEQTLGP